MRDYVLLISQPQTSPQDIPPAAVQKVLEGHAVFGKNLRDSGAYLDSERLRPSHEGKRVSGTNVVDGPFAETKEAVGGYYLIRAENLKAAQTIAEKCPLTPGGSIHVQPVMKGEVQQKKGDKPGKAFGFLVRGKESVMDQIDKETPDSMDAAANERFLGGLRLDGPFAETKEIVGGLFFMRFNDIDEAVTWAKTTPFARLGTLEIRELWRM